MTVISGICISDCELMRSNDLTANITLDSTGMCKKFPLGLFSAGKVLPTFLLIGSTDSLFANK